MTVFRFIEINSLQASFRTALFVYLLCFPTASSAQAPAHQSPLQQQPPAFRFEAYTSLDDMRGFIERRFPLGSFRDDLRAAFVQQGTATLKTHPTQQGVEKYLYDINLCGYYVWRWNISADYDANGRLLQAYLNALPIFKDGTPKRTVDKKALPGQKASIFKASRARPEAVNGEKHLAYLLFDRDSDVTTIDDQSLIGAGPSRADPANMGALVTYNDVEPWRSIFDSDKADRILPHPGDCSALRPLTRHEPQ